MAKESSFDVVSTVDMQEIDNAYQQAKKELTQRYDLKGSGAELSLDKQKKTITVAAPADFVAMRSAAAFSIAGMASSLNFTISIPLSASSAVLQIFGDTVPCDGPSEGSCRASVLQDAIMRAVNIRNILLFCIYVIFVD